MEAVQAPIKVTKREIIEALFDVNPNRHYRAVAAEVGCSPFYVIQVWGLKKLRAKHAHDAHPTLGATALATLRRETERRLDLLSERVAQGLQADEASEFARWLVTSGVLKVCNDHRLERKQCDLLQSCADAWNNKAPGLTPKSMVSICERLAAIESKLSA